MLHATCYTLHATRRVSYIATPTLLVLQIYISYRDCKLGVDILEGLRDVFLAFAEGADAFAIGDDGGHVATGSAPPALPPPPAAAAGSAASTIPSTIPVTAEPNGAGASSAPETLAEATPPPLPPPPPPPPRPETTVSAAIQIDGIRLVLLNDFNGRSIPLVASMLTPLGIAGSGTISHFMIEADIGAQIDLYNAAVCGWEPLVENCGLGLGASLQTGEEDLTQVRVEAPRTCNLNFSSHMCELLSSSVLTLVDDVTGKKSILETPDDPFMPYAITNHVGVPLRYGASGTGPPTSTVIPEGTEE